MLPESVRSIMPSSELVAVMTITSNVMHKPGVNKTDITQPHVPFRNMSMKLVRVTVLCIKVVKPTMPKPVKNLVILTLVRPVRSLKKSQDVVLMILLMELAVRRSVARAILL